MLDSFCFQAPSTNPPKDKLELNGKNKLYCQLPLVSAEQIMNTLQEQQSFQNREATAQHHFKLSNQQTLNHQDFAELYNQSSFNSDTEEICNFTYEGISFEVEEEESPKRKKNQPYVHKKPINSKRKTRTTITEEKIQKLNRIFKVYDYFKQKNQEGKVKNSKLKNTQIQQLTQQDLLLKTFDLKQAARYLDLSYSAVVHKYQEYKQKNKVSCGVRVLSKYQKRKYQKTTKLQELIMQTLKEKSFYTAMQISKYILVKYDLFFSRAKINRTLINLGFSLGVKSGKQAKSVNRPEAVQIRFKYAALYQSLADKSAEFIYIDEHTFLANSFVNQKFSQSPEIILTPGQKQYEKIYVSLMLAINSEKILFWNIKKGFFNAEEFENSMNSFIEQKRRQKLQVNQEKQTVIVTDMNSIHISHLQAQKGDQKRISKRMPSSFKRIYLPPHSPQLNPALFFFKDLQKKLRYKNEITNIDQLMQAVRLQVQNLAQTSTAGYFKIVDEWIKRSLMKVKF